MGSSPRALATTSATPLGEQRKKLRLGERLRVDMPADLIAQIVIGNFDCFLRREGEFLFALRTATAEGAAPAMFERIALDPDGARCAVRRACGR